MVTTRVRAGPCGGISLGAKFPDAHKDQRNSEKWDRHQRNAYNDQSDAGSDFLVSVLVLMLRAVRQAVQNLMQWISTHGLFLSKIGFAGERPLETRITNYRSMPLSCC
jgi:hypothetical protein